MTTLRNPIAGFGARLFADIFAVICLIYLTTLAFKPLADPDLFWHLKTGEWILENRQLPGREDPFSFTIPTPIPDSKLKGIRSQWISQVALSLLNKAGGLEAISIFRALLIVLPFAYIYFRFRKSVSPLLLLPLIVFPPFLIDISLYYTYERPQAFSFIFAIILYILLVRLKNISESSDTVTPKLRAISLIVPLLMLLWANLHGGYIVGAIIIIAFNAGLLLNHALKGVGLTEGVINRKTISVLFIPSVAGIFLTALSPMGLTFLFGWIRAIPYHLAESVWGASGAGGSKAGFVIGEVLEYKSLWYFYKEFDFEWPVYIAGFILIALISLCLKYIERRRLDFTEIFVYGFILFFGVYYARGISFALIFSSFAIASSIRSLKGLKAITPSFLAFVILISLVVLVYKTTPWEFKPHLPSGYAEPSGYLDKAIGFLYENNVEGTMFNDMRWGGYLIWKSTPRYKVFYDGRSINEDVARLYMDVLNASAPWKGILETYKVNFLLIPVMSKESGTVAPLIMKILDENLIQWKLVYLWDNVAIFVKNIPKNKAVIERCNIPALEMYREIRDLSDLYYIISPNSRNLLLSKAYALIGLGDYKSAEEILLTLPSTRLSNMLLEKIKKR